MSVKNDKVRLLIKPALFCLVSLIGVAVVLYHTRFGPALITDSVSYIQGATNLRADRGYGRFSGENLVVPITGFQPFFSVVLAGLSLTGLDIPEAGRILNAFLFGASILLAGLLILQYTNSGLSALVGCLLAVASKDLIVAHSAVLSEALFTFLLLLSIYAFTGYFYTTRRSALVVTGILVALSILTRYAGLSLVVVFSLAVALFRRVSWKNRLVDITLLAGVSLIPMAFWSYRNFALAGTSTNRVIGFYRLAYDLIVAYLDEWLNWLLPFRSGIPWGPRVLLVFGAMLAISIVFILHELKKDFRDSHYFQSRGAVLPWVLLLFLPVYQIFLIANTVFFDASTGVAAARRFMSPILIPVIVLAICMLYRVVWDKPGRKMLKMAGLAYALLVLAFYAQASIGFVKNPGFAYGLTDARRYWTDVVRGLRQLDPSKPLISNDPQLLYVLSDRTAYTAPIGYNRYTQQVNENFANDIAVMRRRMDEGAILVLFKDDPNLVVDREGQNEDIYVTEITKGLQRIGNYSRARVYISPGGMP